MDRSLIAGANAWFRAAESQRSRRILDDPWAIHLAERDLRIQAIRFGRFLLPPLAREIAELQAAHCVRHAAIDALSLRAAADGFRQLVVIGAGYDMRASRLALPEMRVFEVDHPATQARKLERLRGATKSRPVERVGADLLVEDLHVALARTSFDPALPTTFVAEGFIHYLSPHRLDALLSSIERAARRRLVLSYIRTEMYLQADSIFLQLIKAVREIPRLHFTPDELSTRLARHGLSSFRNWDAEAQLAELVPHARGRQYRLSQDVAQAESPR